MAKKKKKRKTVGSAIADAARKNQMSAGMMYFPDEAVQEKRDIRKKKPKRRSY